MEELIYSFAMTGIVGIFLSIMPKGVIMSFSLLLLILLFIYAMFDVYKGNYK